MTRAAAARAAAELADTAPGSVMEEAEEEEEGMDEDMAEAQTLNLNLVSSLSAVAQKAYPHCVLRYLKLQHLFCHALRHSRT